MGQIDSTIVRAHQHAAASGRKGGKHRTDEPDDHALVRSPGGLTSKIHLVCDGRGGPLAILLTPGQRHDGVCTQPLLERIRVFRTGLGRPRCWPDQTLDAEPFLVVGLIAGIRKVLIVTAESEKSFRWNVEGIELLILAGLILVMATAGYVWRRSARPGDHFPLQEVRRSPSPAPSPTPVGES
ncbi:transposase [Streptomyces sp. NPDC059919]|uniref:transposase n=1 Tax=Streptomyces sp. NPDC059919 TaxID=3347004 RepID=UPI00365D5BB0